MNKKLIVAIIVAIVCVAAIIIGAVALAKKPISNLENQSGEISGEIVLSSGEKAEEEPYLGPEIFSGDARPIAVMIDNEKGAWPQAGLNDAYMIYEITVEGGETRFIAFFKGKETEKIGPVRSSRHYFLDYALEHDAIYCHFGWSPKAQSDIKSLKINNINGIYDNYYWREAPKSSYHNAFTSMSNINQFVDRKKYRQVSDKECIISFNQKDTNLESEMTANQVKIKYSYVQNSSYIYDKENKIYLRSMRGIEHRDRWTNEQFYAKNIVIIKVRNDLLDDPENKGRQELYNTGTGDGFYVTNGEYIPIKWSKADRSSRTIYKDLEGKEIKFNDGITWVQIVPVTGTITIE